MTLDFLPERSKLTCLQWIHIIGSNIKHKPPVLCKVSEAVTLEKEESKFFGETLFLLLVFRIVLTTTKTVPYFRVTDTLVLNFKASVKFIINFDPI